MLQDVARKVMWYLEQKALPTPAGLARTGIIGFFPVRDSRLSRMLIELATHDEFGDASLCLLHKLQATAVRVNRYTGKKSFAL